jgi:UDP-4-amino-4,6-dideoxy-N-acetyl-beta-L-altrosamine transaminase
MIPYGRQDIISTDIDAVVKVLKSDFITQGPVVPKFERLICDYTSAKYSIATNSATSALHIACLALGLGAGDYLWTTPNTFVASANCGLYCGSKVDFVDIDPKTYNLSPQLLEKKLIKAEKEGVLPKIVVPVHFSGQSCDMEKIYKLSQKYGFKIIEDASHAIGGKYKGQLIGNCKYSNITIFSFHPVKIITTGEGGIALTNSSVLKEQMQLLRSHGITRDQDLMTQKIEGSWYYQQIGLGYNYRMTDMQAALGISQIKRIDSFINNRHKIKKKYDQKLLEMPVVLPFQDSNAHSAMHLYAIQIKHNIVKKSHKQLFDEMRARNIGVNLHYIPIHLHPYYMQMGFKQGDFPNAESYYSRAMSLPIFNTMTDFQQNKVITALSEVLS